MKQPIIEGNDTIDLRVGSNVISMVFRGRDGIFKVAIFHPITSAVTNLIEIVDPSQYQTLKPDQVTFVYSTVVDNKKNPLTPNGILVTQLHGPFWEILKDLIGEQLESLTDLQAIKATCKMFAGLAKEVKSQDPAIEIFEKQQAGFDNITN